jgi:exodeoxyribonuclease VII large subunit
MENAVTVSQLNRQVRTLLEQGLGRVWVEGEISNIARPASGHMYFRLKDSSAQVSAAWFKQRQRGPTIGIKEGDQVLVFAKVSVYEARGDYQLIVEQVEPAGEGILKRRFDMLKKKLAAEGLFDEDRKQPLPALPRRIGVITSPSGAAVRDILTVLRRRFPAIPVIVYPSAVQGDAAAPELLEALQTAINRDECDVLIMGRGGGSIEDLWAFNDENLARAIVDCPIPVVSAVGHEIDFTIADFVADVRAATPSGAAELVVPDGQDWLRTVNTLAARIARSGQRALDDKAQNLDWLSRRLAAGSPAATVRRQGDRLRELRGQVISIMRREVLLKSSQLQSLDSRLLQLSPATAVQRSIGRNNELRQRLASAAKDLVSATGHRLALAGRALDSVSPLATLGRGYAIVKDASGKVLHAATDVGVGDDVEAQLASGQLVATVKEVRNED